MVRVRLKSNEGPKREEAKANDYHESRFVDETEWSLLEEVFSAPHLTLIELAPFKLTGL